MVAPLQRRPAFPPGPPREGCAIRWRPRPPIGHAVASEASGNTRVWQTLRQSGEPMRGRASTGGQEHATHSRSWLCPRNVLWARADGRRAV
eukprot:6606833-Alexandrium_andersonii.AAC.2